MAPPSSNIFCWPDTDHLDPLYQPCTHCFSFRSSIQLDFELKFKRGTYLISVKNRSIVTAWNMKLNVPQCQCQLKCNKSNKLSLPSSVKFAILSVALLGLGKAGFLALALTGNIPVCLKPAWILAHSHGFLPGWPENLEEIHLGHTTTYTAKEVLQEVFHSSFWNSQMVHHPMAVSYDLYGKVWLKLQCWTPSWASGTVCCTHETCAHQATKGGACPTTSQVHIHLSHLVAYSRKMSLFIQQLTEALTITPTGASKHQDSWTREPL